ncbi:MAG: endolytic transglycosylase MltG [Alphaproteobacteria bacterium]|nr:endolytic transglycosylase MltG [Alphaproteobacteria bacterium]
MFEGLCLEGILMFKKILLLLFILILGVIALGKQIIYADGTLSEDTVIVVKKGSSSAQVANELYKARVINYPNLFKIAARLQKLDRKLKAGEYAFQAKISMIDVLDKMKRGEVMYRQITFPEGLTSLQMVEIINNNEFLEGEISEIPTEGSLLPETYTFMRGDSREKLIKDMQHAMKKALKNVWDNNDIKSPVKNVEELLILASIIEKETGMPEERSLVASVFANRLRRGMRLQTDPTVIYAITNGKFELERTLTRKDLQIKSPYNTYINYGLPPTPICNPGKASLQAAAQPEMTDYLYFVASGNGGHNFAKSLNQHNKNVKKWKKIKNKSL